jgi:hypothetical protein
MVKQKSTTGSTLEAVELALSPLFGELTVAN